jgi:hypothetical protein
MPSLDIITVNFGGPTTGNQEFAAWYNANVSIIMPWKVIISVTSL